MSIPYLLLDLLDLLAVLVEDVLADKVRPLELLARERAQPLVLAQLLRVRHHELLNLVVLVLHPQLGRVLVAQVSTRLHEGSWDGGFRI